MQWLERIREWWRLLRDSREKAKRRQIREGEKMAGFLDRNREADREQDAGLS